MIRLQEVNTNHSESTKTEEKKIATEGDEQRARLGAK